jgi:diguanylate cyclase (GGDEF)-like protein
MERPPYRLATRAWAIVASLVVVVVSIASFVAASIDVGRDRDAAEQAAQSRTRSVAAALQRALAHEADFIVNATGQSILHPTITSTELRNWAEAVDAFTRYPELTGLTVVNIVRPADLAEHIARVTADPPGTYDPAKGFQYVPNRPYYCLFAATVGSGVSPLPVDTDFCPAQESLVLAPRDAGQTTYFPYEYDGETVLSLSTPRFVGGTVPATAEEREANYLGLMGTALRPSVVLDAALDGTEHVGATLRFDDGATKRSFTSGKAPADAVSTTVAIAPHWSIVVSQSPPHASLFADSKSMIPMLGGTVLGLVLGALVFVLGTGRVRALRLVEETTGELRHQALHDGLTGLANRVLLLDRAGQLVARCRRNGTTPAALFLDLDGFKSVNDSLGHEVGDHLLQAVASRLTGALRGADTISRNGGDEFVVLIDGGELDAAPELVAERLRDVLQQPFELPSSDTPIRISASIGIATGDRDEAAELIRDADVALYEAKGAGKNGYAMFAPEMELAMRHEVELEFDLRSALERAEYQLYYQPIYDLANLELIGMEALLRWRHPRVGLVMPDQFIPILERTGMIVDVGRWVLAEACEQMARWQRLGSDLTVSVNVSSRQFDDDGILDDVREALERSGLGPGSLIIEVTESSLMRDTRASVARLAAIKSLGVKVAIDDFGTGYSSLSSLQQLPIDSLKIDRSFVNGLAEAPESRALVRTIVQLGRDLGLTTLAEGVETAEQVDILRGDAVDNAQGFLLARPLDPETIERTILFCEPAERPSA